MSPSPRTAVQNVAQLIKLMMPSGRATVQTCVASMGVAVRTLQRMLIAEGASFSALLSRERMQLATQYIVNPRLPFANIADMLGYSSTGAHSQTFGKPPSLQAKCRFSGDRCVMRMFQSFPGADVHGSVITSAHQRRLLGKLVGGLKDRIGARSCHRR